MEHFEVLKESFLANNDQNRAVNMAAYMKNNWSFLGLRSEVRSDLQSPIFSSLKKADFSEISQLVKLLWNEPYREFQYAACDLMRLHTKSFPQNFIFDLEFYITEKSWWDSVDSIVPSSLGSYFIKYPEQIEHYIPKWVNSNNIWLQRAAILFQLKYKNKTDVIMLFSIVEQLKGGKEFFVNKAIGWALREYSKTNPLLISDFVLNQKLSNLSQREALKIINKNKQI